MVLLARPEAGPPTRNHLKVKSSSLKYDSEELEVRDEEVFSPRCFQSILILEDLGPIQAQFQILAEFQLEALDPIDSIYDLLRGRLGLNEKTLRAGLRLPLYLFFIHPFHSLEIATSLEVPNSW